MKVFCVIVACSFVPAMLVASEEVIQKDKPEGLQVSAEQERLFSLKNAALYSAYGILYLGKGVFYISAAAIPAAAKFTFFTVKTGVRMTITLSSALLKIALLLSGGNALPMALDAVCSALRLLAIAGIVVMGYSALNSPLK